MIRDRHLTDGFRDLIREVMSTVVWDVFFPRAFPNIV
jgi:hypothetical protein